MVAQLTHTLIGGVERRWAARQAGHIASHRISSLGGASWDVSRDGKVPSVTMHHCGLAQLFVSFFLQSIEQRITA